MSVSYYLFSKSSKEYVYLGRKGRRSDFEYEGPMVWLGAICAPLPARLLQTLMERFRQAHGEADVVIRSAEDLFDSTDYLAEDETGVELGGDRDHDLPLTLYLPELDDEQIKEEIRHGYDDLK